MQGCFYTIDKENLCETRTLLAAIIQESFYLNGGVDREKLKLVWIVIFSHGTLLKVKDKHGRLIPKCLNMKSGWSGDLHFIQRFTKHNHIISLIRNAT